MACAMLCCGEVERGKSEYIYICIYRDILVSVVEIMSCPDVVEN